MHRGLGTLSESEASFLAKFWLGLIVSICLQPSPYLDPFLALFCLSPNPEKLISVDYTAWLPVGRGQRRHQQGISGQENGKVLVFIHSTPSFPSHCGSGSDSISLRLQLLLWTVSSALAFSRPC